MPWIRSLRLVLELISHKGLKSVHQTWNQSIRLEISPPDLKPVHQTWNQSAKLKISLPGLKSVCEVWNLCARFEIWLPGLKSFAGFWGLLFEGIANESQCLQTYTYFFRVFYAFTFPFNTRDWENRNQNAAAVVQPKRRENTTAVQLKGRENVTAVQSKIKENAPADQLKGREEVKFVVNFNLFETFQIFLYKKRSFCFICR